MKWKWVPTWWRSLHQQVSSPALCNGATLLFLVECEYSSLVQLFALFQLLKPANLWKTIVWTKPKPKHQHTVNKALTLDWELRPLDNLYRLSQLQTTASIIHPFFYFDTFLNPSINGDRSRFTEELILLCDSIPAAETLSRMLPQLSRPDPTMSGTNRGIIIGQDFILLTHHDIPPQSEHYAVLRTVKDSRD